jgi:hypothetical protein
MKIGSGKAKNFGEKSAAFGATQLSARCLTAWHRWTIALFRTLGLALGGSRKSYSTYAVRRLVSEVHVAVKWVDILLCSVTCRSDTWRVVSVLTTLSLVSCCTTVVD